ncbi:MAG: hypothetical protein ACR2K4_07805 [Candidatus Limnocylindria bacterium]
MTDAPYPPLRPQRPDRRRRRGRSQWPTIAGGLLLLFLTPILIVALLGGRGTDPGTGATSSDSGSPAVLPSTSPSVRNTPGIASERPTAGASADPSALAVDSIVTTTVERLSIRRGPSVDAERLGSIGLGTPGYVVDGPVDADGFRWYLVSTLGLPPNSGCLTPIETDPYSCPAWFGWLAGEPENADSPWLEPHQIDCPAPPLTAERLLLRRTDLERLACSGAEPFTFRAWWPEVPLDVSQAPPCGGRNEPAGWLLCHLANDNVVTIGEDPARGGVGTTVSIDPATDVTMPPRGTWIELRVHLDDPAAQECDMAAAAGGGLDRPPEQIVLDCRGEMVVESVRAVDGP